MSVLPYLFTDDETIDALPLLDFGSSVCRSLLQGRSCSIGRMSVAPLRVVFSIVSSFRAIQMLAALAFPFCFQFLLAALCAAMLVVSCLLFSGIERVPAFKFPLLLDPGLFEHVAHVWRGKLEKDESEENVSLLNSGAKSFQVPSCGIPDGFLLAPDVREFWKERHWSIIDNDDRDAVVEISESKFVAAAAPGTCRSQPEKIGSCPVWSSHPVLHQGGQRYSHSGGEGRKSGCIGPGCWNHGHGHVCHGLREGCGSFAIPGMYWHHAELHCILLLPTSWWVP